MPPFDPVPLADLARSARERRDLLAARIGQGVVILATAPERTRNRDAHYPYRFDSYFYYLTAFIEPEAVVVIVAGASPKHILFCRERDPEREVWDGYRHGPAAACERFAFDEAYPIGELDARLPKLIADQPALYCAIGDDPAWTQRISGWLNEVRALARTGVRAPSTLGEVRELIDAMRVVKSAQELVTMRRAAAISCDAHRRAMHAARAGRFEYEVEAELLHAFRRAGAQAPAYTSIVAGGANACVLHYVENNALLEPGALVLIDAGCELDGYASDITRTFPVDGRFTGAQRALYECVLAAQLAAIAAVRPGASWQAPHDAAVQILAQGFVDLGLCAGPADRAIESGDYKRFYMHRTGHWLGLDVHDAGEYKHDGEWVTLVPGQVTTVEPGCYVRPAADVPEAFWNIGIRIEDDVVVTEHGAEVITADAPKRIDDIEAWMRERS
ncbi:MAG: aminopeptidase P N-terminal domain-containing protein [Proteobacteria bacterium]|nr:aminopeptidase P N-terminal domain-containing protein [Burkholderiales bacterium]